MKKLIERRVNPDLLKLNQSQKRVLMKTIAAGDPKRAAEDIAAASDSRNLMSAVKVLARYGLVVTYPENLGPDDEPAEVELTDEGQAHADDYNVMDDETLRTPEEVKASAPQDQPADTDTGELEMEFGVEQPAGSEMDLELSSFFKDINDLSQFLKG